MTIDSLPTDRAVAVIGAGAIGGMIGGYLSRLGCGVTLIDPWFQHVEAMKRGGLRITALDEDFTVPVEALHVDELDRMKQSIGILFVCVKAYDIEWAVRFLAPYLSSDAWVVSTQNGVNDERIANIVGAPRVVGCSVVTAASLDGIGHVTRATSKDRGFVLGELDGGESPRLAALRALLEPMGRTDIARNWAGTRWSKLVGNCMMNALSGLTRYTMLGLLSDPRARPLMIRLGSEAVEVAEAIGHRVEKVYLGMTPDLLRAAQGDRAAFEEVQRLIDAERARRTGPRDNRPSIGQDIERGRRTEIDYLNGYVARLGAAVGVPTPLNTRVTALIKRIERGEVEPDPSLLDAWADDAQAIVGGATCSTS